MPPCAPFSDIRVLCRGLFGGLKVALQALGTHKLRTILAMLGVFLGALALTGVMHVSKAMVMKAEIETAKLGPNLFAAVAGKVRIFSRGIVRSGSEPTTFTLDDAEALLTTIPLVQNGAPFISSTMAIGYLRTTATAQIVATSPQYPAVRSFVPTMGRFISQQDLNERAKVCVLGRTIATKLFGTPEAALGKTVLLQRAGLEVVGIMEEKGSDLSGTDQDEQVFVPITTFMRRMSNQNYISGVYMTLRDGVEEEDAKATAIALLRSRHHILEDGKDDFAVMTASDASALKTQALDLVWTLGVMSSGISFMVGTLGILSIMILLVRSRRLEIGIRRAVGAKRQSIVLQFLLEAALMSGTGGLCGVCGALLCVTAVYRIGEFPYVYDPLLIALASGASVLFGILAGAYPAWKASRVEVLDVLRSHDT